MFGYAFYIWHFCSLIQLLCIMLGSSANLKLFARNGEVKQTKMKINWVNMFAAIAMLVFLTSWYLRKKDLIDWNTHKWIAYGCMTIGGLASLKFWIKRFKS